MLSRGDPGAAASRAGAASGGQVQSFAMGSFQVGQARIAEWCQRLGATEDLMQWKRYPSRRRIAC